MQSVNVMAVTPVFMTALFGTGALCAALAIWALVDWSDAYGPYLLAGSALYLACPVGLTMGYHVPRNDALAGVQPTTGEAAAQWRRYVAEWTRGNHVRVAAGLGAAAAFTGRSISAEPARPGPHRRSRRPARGRAPDLLLAAAAAACLTAALVLHGRAAGSHSAGGASATRSPCGAATAARDNPTAAAGRTCTGAS
jgi:uncharacterized membrane protein